MAETKKPTSRIKGIEKSAIRSAEPPRPASLLKRHTSQVVNAVETDADRQDDGEGHVAVGLVDKITRRRCVSASWP